MMVGDQASVRVRRVPVTPLLLACTFLLLYFPTMLGLVRSWLSNEDYSHGFLIIPISLYLIWSRRRDMLENQLRPSLLGIPFLMLWAVLFTLGVGAEIATFERVSLIVFLMGCVLLLAGRDVAGKLVLPVLFLTFMIPIPSEIYSALTNPLAIMATSYAVSIMHLASIPVCQQGNLILMPDCSLEVLGICSGIRSLVSIIALALLVGCRIFSTSWQMLCLIVLSIPVSIIGNIVRITITGCVSYAFSYRFSFMGLHAVAGVSAFVMSFLLLLAAGWAIRWVELKRMQYISWFLR